MFAAAADFQPTTIAIETCTGTGARGKVYAASRDRSVYIADSRKLVRAANGNQVISETTVYDDPDQESLYLPDSRVTVNGRTALVILAKPNVIGDPDVDHIAVHLT